MKNLCLLVAYDGTDFLGWQKTKMGPSIEETLQAALRQILQEEIALQAASRTDAGVHARGQVVNFMTSKKGVDLSQFVMSLNSLLPGSIVVLDSFEAPMRFHPSLDAASKQYRYYLCNSRAQLPEYRNFSWHCPYSLDIVKMREAARSFLGTHDFAALCNAKKNEHYKDMIRTVYSIDITSMPENRLCIAITGNNFLYKMVRNLVGTLVYVGRGKLCHSAMEAILKGKKRADAGVTAPAHGLTLFTISWNSDSFTSNDFNSNDGAKGKKSYAQPSPCCH